MALALCPVCFEREACAMGANLLARGCVNCGMQICGVCAEMCHHQCPQCRNPNFGRLPTRRELEELWAKRAARDDARDLAWVAVDLGDICTDDAATAETDAAADGETALAIEFYTAAFELGSPVAAGRLYPYTSCVKRRFKMLKRHAVGKRGEVSPVAQFNLALAYEFVGEHTKAFRFFSFSARAGHADAAFQLGCGFEARLGRGQNTRLSAVAAKYFRIAAKGGIPGAHYRLGLAAMANGDIPGFYSDMQSAARLGCFEATECMYLALNSDMASRFCNLPERPHCCVCMRSVSDQRHACCARCDDLYCSDGCRDLDITYGPKRERCRMNSGEWLGPILNTLFGRD
jgi:hypothetical protein